MILRPPISLAFGELLLSKAGNPAVWPLDEPAGASALRELSGRYPGTPSGGLTLGSAGPIVAGETQTAAANSGTGAIATAMPAPAGAFTLGALVKPTSGVFCVGGLRDTGAEPSLITNAAGNNRPLAYMNSANYRYFNPVNLMDGLWHLIMLTVPGAAQTDINSAACYVDGIALGVMSTAASGAQQARSQVHWGKNNTFANVGSLAWAFCAGTVWTAGDAMEIYQAILNGV